MQNGKRPSFRLSSGEKEKVLTQISHILAARPEIGFAALHGSFLEDVPFHDIDIGVHLAVEAENTNPLLFAADLAGDIEREVRFPIDVRIINHAPASFLFSVIRGRLLLDRMRETREDLVEDVIRRYLDIKPILRRAAREAFER